MSWRAALVVAAAALVLVNIPVTLLVAPEAADFRAPLTQRIFYYHVPTAWAAYVAFAVTAVASALVLWRRDARHDAVAAASAEVGTVFAIVALGTGLVWSSQEFVNYDALQDAKVITLVVVILAYFAYFALRSGIPERARRARLSAVYGIVALLSVPLSYLASRASVHPDFTSSGGGLDPRLGVVLLGSTVVFTVLYAALVVVRVQLTRVEEALEED